MSNHSDLTRRTFLSTAAAAATVVAAPFTGIAAALQGVPADLYEAATADGANAWDRFRHVTYPGILPTLMLLALLAFIFSFQQFTLIWKTTGGGPVNATQTISILIYNTAFQFFDYSYASAIGVSGFVLSMLAAVLFIFLVCRLHLCGRILHSFARKEVVLLHGFSRTKIRSRLSVRRQRIRLGARVLSGHWHGLAMLVFNVVGCVLM